MLHIINITCLIFIVVIIGVFDQKAIEVKISSSVYQFDRFLSLV